LNIFPLGAILTHEGGTGAAVAMMMFFPSLDLRHDRKSLGRGE
jgi:hypothetical protein